jgi:hypothetical protein
LAKHNVNPTFLPNAIAVDYDRLWTPERMQKVIDAAKRNDVAIEINNTYRLPSPAFIKAAKKAGVKFSFGTNNGDRKLGRLEYGVDNGEGVRAHVGGHLCAEARRRETRPEADAFVKRRRRVIGAWRRVELGGNV